MFKEFEFDNKTIVDLIIKSKEFFENVDENFYDGVQELIKVTYERLKEEGLFRIYKKYRYGETDETMAVIKKRWYPLEIPNRKYVKPVNTPEKTYNIVEDFFNSFGKMYGESAHYFLKSTPATITDRALEDDDYIFRFSEIEDSVMLEDASNNLYTIEGNYLDVIVISHEIAHQLTNKIKHNKQIDTDEDNILKNNGSKNSDTTLQKSEEIEENFINNSSFYETTAMYTELLCADYLKEKYGCEEYAKWAMSTRGIGLLEELRNNDISTKISTLSEWVKLVKEIGTEEDDIEKVKGFIQKHDLIGRYKVRKECMSSGLVTEYQHLLGYFYAVFLKRLNESNREFSNNNGIFDRCIKINSFGAGFHDEEMELLKQLHLPIVKDGKFVMDENAIFKLSSAYLRYFRENLKSVPTKAKNGSTLDMRRDFINSGNEGNYLKDVQDVRGVMKKEDGEKKIEDGFER